MILYLVIFGVAIALLFDFLNGMNDAANSIATLFQQEYLSPLVPLLGLLSLTLLHILFLVLVLQVTIGKGIVDPKGLSIYTLYLLR